MAQFNIAYNKTLAHEGGYVNDPDDTGGETYCGIARKHHPDWLGWKIIDYHKTKPNFPENLKDLEALTRQKSEFYHAEYWSRLQADYITSQQIANSLFDFAVNAGINTAVTLAQKVTGAVQDGIIGPATIAKINQFNPEHFEAAYTVEKIRRYVQIINRRHESKKYFFGWVTRAVTQ